MNGSIRIFVPDGDPQGVKIVERLNWTGVGLAFPRSAWPQSKWRSEFTRAGIYILTGTAEGTTDDLPTVYVGQAEEIGTRIDSHYGAKDFWNWGYAFVSNGNPLNRAHTTWLEHALIHRADKAKRSHLDNGTLPNEPRLSESEKADTEGFLRELLRILPLLGVDIFQKPEPVATPGTGGPVTPPVVPGMPADDRDTVVVPAQAEGFNEVFLGQHVWFAIRIGGGMLNRIKYIAAYQTAPVRADGTSSPCPILYDVRDPPSIPCYSATALADYPAPFVKKASSLLLNSAPLLQLVKNTYPNCRSRLNMNAEEKFRL